MFVNLIICVLSLVGTSSFYFLNVLKFTSPFSYVVPVLIFLGFVVAFELLFLLWGLISTLFVNRKKDYFKINWYYKLLVDIFMGWLCSSARLKMKVTGLDKIPTEERFLLVQNHVSNFDPIVTYYYFKHPHMAFISKPSNFSIPIAGPGVKRVGFLSIDRENPRNAMKTIQVAADKLKENDYSFGVYPEGTRNKSGEGLLEFKHGCIKIAQKAQKPIVITTIKGTKNIHKNFPLKRTKIQLDVLKVLNYEEYKDLSSQEISDIIRKTMLDNLESK